jgi:hypothetical protein
MSHIRVADLINVCADYRFFIQRAVFKEQQKIAFSFMEIKFDTNQN